VTELEAHWIGSNQTAAVAVTSVPCALDSSARERPADVPAKERDEIAFSTTDEGHVETLTLAWWTSFAIV
jgi:hypothetical protein